MEVFNFRTPYEAEYRNDVRNVDIKTGDWRSQRPVFNLEKCCRCGWCYLYCLSGCIEDKGAYFLPNLDYCKGCGVCAEECPTFAIKMTPEELRYGG